MPRVPIGRRNWGTPLNDDLTQIEAKAERANELGDQFEQALQNNQDATDILETWSADTDAAVADRIDNGPLTKASLSASTNATLSGAQGSDSLASGQRRFVTASTFSEAWGSTAAWLTGGLTFPVASGNLYGVNDAQPALSQAVAAGRKMFTTGLVGIAGGSDRITMLGWSNATAGTRANAGDLFAVGIRYVGGVYDLIVWYRGSGVVQSVPITAPDAGAYSITLWEDETVCGVELRAADGSKVASLIQPLSTFTPTQIAVWASDARGLTGDYVGRINGRGDTVTHTNTLWTGYSPQTVIVPDTLGGNTRVVLPKNYDSRAAYPVVLHTHGFGVDQRALMKQNSASDIYKVSDEFLNTGRAIVIASGAGGSDEVGSGYLDYVAAWDYVRSRFSASGKVLLMPESFGGVATSRLLARDGAIPGIVGVLGYYPVLDLAGMYATGGAFDDAINTRYGSLAAAQAAGADPALIPAPSFRGVPWRVYHSPDDTVVNKTWTDALDTRLSAVGVDFTTIATTGDHGNASNYTVGRIAEAMAFFDACVA